MFDNLKNVVLGRRFDNPSCPPRTTRHPVTSGDALPSNKFRPCHRLRIRHPSCDLVAVRLLLLNVRPVIIDTESWTVRNGYPPVTDRIKRICIAVSVDRWFRVGRAG